MKKKIIAEREAINIKLPNRAQGSIYCYPSDISLRTVLKSFRYGYVKASSFFGITIPKIKLTLAYDRKELNKLAGFKTSRWFVGYANSFDKIVMFSPSVFEKESGHPEKDFKKVLCHEISHLFIRQIHKSYEPIWLDEGLSYIVAGQINKSKRIHNSLSLLNPEMVFHLDTKKKWEKSLSHDSHTTYVLSSLFVNFLIEYYGKEKILTLLVTLPDKYSREQFCRDFRKVYRKDITKVVEQFLLIQKMKGGERYVAELKPSGSNFQVDNAGSNPRTPRLTSILNDGARGTKDSLPQVPDQSCYGCYSSCYGSVAEKETFVKPE